MRYESQKFFCCAALIVALLAGVAFVAEAELQNVNGFYILPETERFVRTKPLTQKGDAESQRVVEANWYINLDSGTSWFRATLPKVTVPDVPCPKSHPALGRIALNFYYGVPGWSADTPREGDLIVDINGYQVFNAPLTEPGWHPRLVDLRPWAGEVVNITFRGAWMTGEPSPVVIALARIVAWHGPYSDGSTGGIRIQNSGHGGRSILVVSPERAEKLSLSFGVDGTLFKEGPLLVECFDVYRPSRLLIKSTSYEYTASLKEGRYWLPLPLAAEDRPYAGVWVLEGDVERGPIDIIPNFMANDADYLRAIETRLKTDSIQPTETPE